MEAKHYGHLVEKSSIEKMSNDSESKTKNQESDERFCTILKKNKTV